MDKKNKNIQEMRKMGFSQKTLSLLNESEIAVLLEKIKKGETKEAETTITTTKKIGKDEPLKDMTPAQLKQAKDTKTTKENPDGSIEITTTKKEVGEAKKKKKKYNPWAVCTAQVGRKDKKKYEKCVMGVKEKIKEGRNPYEYLIESKMEEIVSEHLSPKMTKSELVNMISEKKMTMKKPIGKMMSMKGETMEGDTKTAPAPVRTTPAEPKTKPSHPGRKTGPQENPKPKAEDEKDEIIKLITKLISKGK